MSGALRLLLLALVHVHRRSIFTAGLWVHPGIIIIAVVAAVVAAVAAAARRRLRRIAALHVHRGGPAGAVCWRRADARRFLCGCCCGSLIGRGFCTHGGGLGDILTVWAPWLGEMGGAGTVGVGVR